MPPASVIRTAKASPVTPPHDAVVAQVKGALQAWAKAWANQDIQDYLGAYVPDYSPADMSHQAWLAQRRRRVARPDRISVTLKEIEVGRIQDGSVTVHLVQVYRSNSYHDRTRKAFVLRRVDGRWRIGSEKSVEVMARW